MAEEGRYIWHCGNCRKDRYPIWNGRTEPSCIVCWSTDMEVSRPEEDVAVLRERRKARQRLNGRMPNVI